MASRETKRPRIDRTLLAVLHDGLMVAVSFYVSLYLRLGPELFLYDGALLFQDMALLAGMVLLALRVCGLYRGIWRYASLEDLFAITRAVTIAIVAYTLLLFFLVRLEGQPRSTLVINWFVLIALLSGPRILYRVFKDGRFDRVFRRSQDRRVPVLLVGAGDGAASFVSETRRDKHSSYVAVGILGLKATRVGRAIHRVPVLGTVEDLAQAVARLDAKGLRPQRLILTTDEIAGARLRALIDEAGALGLVPGRMPRLTELGTGVEAAGPGKVAVRPIALEDLLGRPQRVLDRAAMARLISKRRILITGAGGTIGSELARQIAALGPAHLTLLDSSEYALYRIDQDLATERASVRRDARLGDVRDRPRLARILAEARPDLVFHAAALKHVPMVEANPLEGILTNAIGTRNLAECCRSAGVTAMVMISTDKAVHPANVMGATKRVAEQICQALDLAGPEAGGDLAAATRFVTVRFGNVLGSTGSVVPLFQRQLAAGGPLTVTHPEVTRYFMTVREAVELVLQASALALPTEHPGPPPDKIPGGGIFVLEMGEPVRIADLARQMIRLAGLVPDRDVRLEYVGLRAGEKLQEALFHEAEPPVSTRADGIMLAQPRTLDYAVLARILDELEDQTRQGRTERALALLARLVPEFIPDAALDPAQPARDTAPVARHR